MERKDHKILGDVIRKLNERKDIYRDAFFGFDACIDYLVRVVKEKKGKEDSAFFNESSQFARFISDLNDKSCGIELHTKLSKPGGNMFITSNALGNLGVKSECVGTYGFPEILPVFKAASPNCSLHTIGETINATALEFDSSKVIMFDPGPYDNLSWESIRDSIGAEQLTKMIKGKKLVSFLNWSEIAGSTEIWRGFLNEIISNTFRNGNKSWFFTDFSDCSRKTADEIKEVIGLLGQLRSYFSVCLSLNQKEADLVATAFGLKNGGDDKAFITRLASYTNTDILIIHRLNDAISFDGAGFSKSDTFLCSEPRILTGGGDNFNAGFCYALLSDLDQAESLLVANAVAGCYVRNGVSPDTENLAEFLRENASLF